MVSDCWGNKASLRLRIDSLQVVRAFAFIGVYLYHTACTFPGEGRIYNFFVTAPGRWGVSVFFVLSGFLMTYSYWDRAPRHNVKEAILFAVRKIRKLYPLHLVMLLVGVIYSLWQKQSFIKLIIKLVLTATLVQTWFPTGYQAINSVAWYLSVTLFLYFCFPFVMTLMKKNKNMQISLISIILIYSIQFISGFCAYNFTDLDIKWITYCHPLYRLGDFIIGCLLASIFLEKCQNEIKHSTIYYSIMEACAVVINVAVCVYCANASGNMQWFRYTCLFVPSSALLVYIFAANKGIFAHFLCNRIVLWIAGISPFAFLIHRLVISIFHEFVIYIFGTDRMNILVTAGVPFLVTVAMIYLYLFIEKRINKHKVVKERGGISIDNRKIG